MNLNKGTGGFLQLSSFISYPLSYPHRYPRPTINMGQYLLKKTIKKHYDSVNVLAFSHDRSLFASAADDGLIIIFQANGSGQEVRRFQVKAPAITLLWRSRFGNTLVAGDTSGDVHTISLNPSTNVSVTSKWT